MSSLRNNELDGITCFKFGKIILSSKSIIKSEKLLTSSVWRYFILDSSNS